MPSHCLLDIDVLDNVVIGASEYVSLRALHRAVDPRLSRGSDLATKAEVDEPVFHRLVAYVEALGKERHDRGVRLGRIYQEAPGLIDSLEFARNIDGQLSVRILGRGERGGGAEDVIEIRGSGRWFAATLPVR